MLSIAIGEVIKIPPSVKMVVSSHKVARVANLRFFHKVISRISQMKLAFLGKVFSGMEPTIFPLPQNVN